MGKIKYLQFYAEIFCLPKPVNTYPEDIDFLSGSYDDTDLYFCFILTVARVLSHQLMMAGWVISL